MFIDPKMNFIHHVKTLIKKLSCALFFMQTAKNMLSVKSLKFIYNSIFHSHLIYGIQMWGSGPKYLTNELFKLQKKAIRLIHNARYNSHTESLFKKSCILPLPDLIEFFRLQFMQRYTQGFLPRMFDNMWINANAHFQAGEIQYALRNRDNFYLPLCRLSSLDAHPYFLFPRIWHEFNIEDIKIIRDKNEFNRKLKDFYLAKLKSDYTCNRLLCPHCHIPRVSDSSSD